MKKLYFVILFISIFGFKQNYAVTAYPYPVTIEQPDGTKLTVVLKGDEHLHWATTTDGYTLMRNQEGIFVYAEKNSEGDLIPSAVKATEVNQRGFAELSFLKGLQKNLFYSGSQLSVLSQIKQIRSEQLNSAKAFPTTGSRKLICILVSFTDVAFTKTQENFNDLFNQVGYSAGGATGSVKDYYLENSYNQFNLTVDVAGPYTLSHNMMYYGENDGDGYDLRPREMVSEAVNAANAAVNFADYDNDTDGYVDGVYVIYAGFGEEAGASANAIWAHAWTLSPTVTLDGKTISKYSCSAELRGNSGSTITAIGVICHEFGHVLGAPDYYDTNYSTGGQFEGTGDWDMMAGGSWNNSGVTPAHHNAYTKVVLYNWATATTLSSATTINLDNAELNANSFFKFNTATTNEYFLMENRQQTGFDAYLPGHGLIIYHVHSSVGTTAINATHPQRMYPVCASATSDPTSTPSSYGSINSAGCPFPGSTNKTVFNDTNYPTSKSWAGANTGKPLSGITENTGLITLDFMGGAAGNPLSLTANAISGSRIDITWSLNNGKDVLLVWSADNVFGTPQTGTTYTVGQTISGGGTVIYKGSNTSYSHTSLSSTTTYYYKAYSILTTTPTYSTGSTADATTLCGSSSLPFTENFNGTSIPSCWSQVNTGSGVTDRWAISTTNLAGGTANEMKATYQSANPATARLVTPPISTENYATVSLSFKHMLDAFGEGVTLKIQSSPDKITWTDEAWSVAATASNISATTVTTSITSNLNIATTYIAFTLEGNLFQYDAWYIDNVSVTGTLITNDPEPSSHITNLAATIGSGNELTLTWTDATGGQLPYGYLIKGSTSGFDAITPPVDGSPVADGELVKNIIQGTQTVTFTGLSQQTTYYFKIWPYTNPASANINYKTDGSVPEIQKLLPFNPDVTVGTGTVTNNGLPIEPYYGYSYSQSIYLQSEINKSDRVITKIAYKYNGNSAWTDQIVIYMGHTTKTSFSSTTDWITVSSLTQVYSGSLAVSTTSGWVYLTLNTPFEYNNTQNLVIAVDENTSGYHSNSDEFYCTLTSGVNRSILYYNDNTNPDPAGPPTATTLRTYYPNVTFTMNPKITFTGGTDNLWTTAANWPGNAVPDSSYMVTIPAGKTLVVPSGKASAECKSLTIDPLANLTVDGSLNVTGNFLIKSNHTGSGSLIDNGTLTISGTRQVQLYLDRNDRYYYVSSPVGGATAGVFGNVATTDLLYYRNTSGSSWERVSNPATELAVGQGFATKQANAATTVTFNGPLNTGLKTLQVVNAGDNWNLVGNPYPSPIDWGCENDPASGWTINNIKNVIYVKHGGNFATWNAAGNGTSLNGGTRYIPAMQSFWVKSLGAGVSMNVNNMARVHNGNILLKEPENKTNELLVTVSHGDYSDQALLRFHPEAQPWIDKYDAEKMFATEDVYPQVYFTAENQKLAMAALEPFAGVYLQTLCFKTNFTGHFALDFSGMESFGLLSILYLEDKYTCKLVNINENPVYAFESASGDFTNRFVIHISDGTTHYNPADEGSANGIDIKTANVKVYGYNNTINIKADKSLKATIEVYNLTGSELRNIEMNGTMQSIDMENQGTYIVKIISAHGIMVQKVNID